MAPGKPDAVKSIEGDSNQPDFLCVYMGMGDGRMIRGEGIMC
jgi:hypothetical protein